MGSNPPWAGQILEQGAKAPHPQGSKPYGAENQHLLPQGRGYGPTAMLLDGAETPSSTKNTVPHPKWVL